MSLSYSVLESLSDFPGWGPDNPASSQPARFDPSIVSACDRPDCVLRNSRRQFAWLKM